jgi:hypothetical protein
VIGHFVFGLIQYPLHFTIPFGHISLFWLRGLIRWIQNSIYDFHFVKFEWGSEYFFMPGNVDNLAN